VICDNYATHKHPVVRGWPAKPADDILARLNRHTPQ
jgi:hypothetical protein